MEQRHFRFRGFEHYRICNVVFRHKRAANMITAQSSIVSDQEYIMFIHRINRHYPNYTPGSDAVD